jgi:hypothetical protein
MKARVAKRKFDLNWVALRTCHLSCSDFDLSRMRTTATIRGCILNLAVSLALMLPNWSRLGCRMVQTKQEIHSKNAGRFTHRVATLTERSSHFVDAERVERRSLATGQVGWSAQFITRIEATANKLVPFKQTYRFETKTEKKLHFADKSLVAQTYPCFIELAGQLALRKYRCFMVLAGLGASQRYRCFIEVVGLGALRTCHCLEEAGLKP